MAKGENQKLKLLYLRDFLLETDIDHPITMEEILIRLKELHVDAERKSIYSDIEALRDYGMEIELKKLGRTAAYYLKSREFESSELKMLIDAVQTAHSLPEHRMQRLLHKIASLSSRYESDLFNRKLYVMNRNRAKSDSLYRTLDMIHAAIAANSQIRFRYWRYGPDMKQVFENGGKAFRVSPYALIWDHENYHLIAFNSETNGCEDYRVDRMSNAAVLQLPRSGQEVFAMLDIRAFSSCIPDKDSPEPVSVVLQCRNCAADRIADRFGPQISVQKASDETFLAAVKAIPSPDFFGWLCSLEGLVSISEPEAVRERYHSFLKKLTDTV